MHIEPTERAAANYFGTAPDAPVVMLNLIRYREVADYSATPELAPREPISGESAYRLYMEHTAPFLEEAGGELVFLGKGGELLIGPSDERWDLVLLVKHENPSAFMGFAQNRAYLAGLGHRTAALADSRLLPMTSIGA